MSTSPPAPSSTAAKPQQSEPRKFPAPCWTHEDTVALIGAYGDKWYSLRRRNLRTTDWDAVADEVNSRCPHQPLPKTSAQCRHKMEKLRKRYRAEKQKKVAAPFSGRVSSSWVYFDLMDAMESGSSVPGGSRPDLTARKVDSSKGGSFGAREVEFGGIDDAFKRKGGVNGISGCPLNEAMDVFGGSSGKMGCVPVKFKLKNHGASSSMDYVSNMNMVGLDDDDEEDDDVEDEEGGDEGLVNRWNGNYVSNKVFHGKSFGSRSNRFEMNSGRSSGGFDSRGLDGVWKKTAAGGEGRGGGGGEKRGMDLFASEMVASIKMLADGFMKMEKMKMDMVREIERTRVEMDIKRSAMQIESQQQIVNAFIEGMIEKRKKKKAKVNQMGESNES